MRLKKTKSSLLGHLPYPPFLLSELEHISWDGIQKIEIKGFREAQAFRNVLATAHLAMNKIILREQHNGQKKHHKDLIHLAEHEVFEDHPAINAPSFFGCIFLAVFPELLAVFRINDCVRH